MLESDGGASAVGSIRKQLALNVNEAGELCLSAWQFGRFMTWLETIEQLLETQQNLIKQIHDVSTPSDGA